MSLVDWTPLLSKVGGNVEFSTFSESFNESVFYAVLSCLHIPDKYYIDVAYEDKNKCFEISLFADPLEIDTFDFVIEKRICHNAGEVYSIVEGIINDFPRLLMDWENKQKLG